MDFLGTFNYVIYVALMMLGLYAALSKENLVKKVIGLSLFQTGIFIFYISLGVVDGGTAPIRWEHDNAWRARYQVTQLRQLLESSRLPGLNPGERAAALEALEEGDAAAALAALPALPPKQQARVDHLTRPGAARGEHAASDDFPYSNPLPHVLILTAIVVSVSTMAVALALVVGIKRELGTIEADELAALNAEPPAP